MTKIIKNNDGTLYVPMRIEEDGVLGDTMKEIKPDHEEYQMYLTEFNREQEIKRGIESELNNRKNGLG